MDCSGNVIRFHGALFLGIPCKIPWHLAMVLAHGSTMERSMVFHGKCHGNAMNMSWHCIATTVLGNAMAARGNAKAAHGKGIAVSRGLSMVSSWAAIALCHGLSWQCHGIQWRHHDDTPWHCRDIAVGCTWCRHCIFLWVAMDGVAMGCHGTATGAHVIVIGHQGNATLTCGDAMAMLTTAMAFTMALPWCRSRAAMWCRYGLPWHCHGSPWQPVAVS